jgi:hypothetical protein
VSLLFPLSFFHRQARTLARVPPRKREERKEGRGREREREIERERERVKGKGGETIKKSKCQPP